MIRKSISLPSYSLSYSSKGFTGFQENWVPQSNEDTADIMSATSVKLVLLSVPATKKDHCPLLEETKLSAAGYCIKNLLTLISAKDAEMTKLKTEHKQIIEHFEHMVAMARQGAFDRADETDKELEVLKAILADKNRIIALKDDIIVKRFDELEQTHVPIQDFIEMGKRLGKKDKTIDSLRAALEKKKDVLKKQAKTHPRDAFYTMFRSRTFRT
ncbi:hypothetical protein CBOM_01070 [Ceraceosorus bombacis]|uniref:Uncharacterized protein n=1 Tax=Ceraceosorus bombacis TaxID=401625 RepID=A0A0P1BD19_9BASI|nr:hypothetical protein CBOM_01070 [Ceraceosorus bombacis]